MPPPERPARPEVAFDTDVPVHPEIATMLDEFLVAVLERDFTAAAYRLSEGRTIVAQTIGSYDPVRIVLHVLRMHDYQRRLGVASLGENDTPETRLRQITAATVDGYVNSPDGLRRPFLIVNVTFQLRDGRRYRSEFYAHERRDGPGWVLVR